MYKHFIPDTRLSTMPIFCKFILTVQTAALALQDAEETERLSVRCADVCDQNV